MTTALRFVEESHEYYLGDRLLVSVTQALGEAGLIDADWYTEASRLRGTYVHQALEWLDRGELEEPEEGHWLLDYIAQYRRFCADCRPHWTHVEHQMRDEARGLAGTLDRAGRLNGHAAILDIKTGPPLRWHQLQTAAYLDLARTEGLFEPAAHVRRYGLHLTPETYRLIEHTDRRDRAIFLSALTVAQFKRAA
jgi:hypothetical protein